MNPFLSDKIPFVLTALLAISGWLMTQFTQAINDISFVKYDVSSQSADDNGHFSLELSNGSLTNTVRNLHITLRCIDSTGKDGSCFKNLSSDVNNPVYGEYRPIGALRWIQADNQFNLKDNASWVVSLPPGSTGEIYYSISKDHRVEYTFTVSDEEKQSYIISEGNTIMFFVASNYINIIIFMMFALFFLIGYYIFSLRNKAVAPAVGEDFRVGVQKGKDDKTFNVNIAPADDN